MIKSIALISASGFAMAQNLDSADLAESRLPFLGSAEFDALAGEKIRDKNDFSLAALTDDAANAVLDSTYGDYDYDSIMSEVQTLLNANGVTHTEAAGDFAQNVSPGRPASAPSASSQASTGLGKTFTVEEGFTGTAGLTCSKCTGTLAHCIQAVNNVAETCNESQGACRMRIEKYKDADTYITMGCANYKSCQKQRNENSNGSGHPATYNCNDNYNLLSRFNKGSSVCHQCCTRDNCFQGNGANVVYTDASAATTDVDSFTSTDFQAPVSNDGANA